MHKTMSVTLRDVKRVLKSLRKVEYSSEKKKGGGEDEETTKEEEEIFKN